MFKSIEECTTHLAQQILQDNVAIWSLIGIGVIVSIFGLIMSYRGKYNPLSTIVFVLIGGALVGVSLTGYLPTISGFSSNADFDSMEVKREARAFCTNKENITPDDIQTDVEVVEVSEIGRDAAIGNLETISDERSFAWVFYAESRDTDAGKITEILEGSDVLAISEVSDFSGVKNPQRAGTIRILFSSESYRSLAVSITETLKSLGYEPVVLQSPFNLARGPVQIQLY